MRRTAWMLGSLAAYLFLLPTLTWAWSGKVVGVIDGDSITVGHDGRQEQIRFWGIDCPDQGQDFGNRAKDVTSIMVFAKVVEVEPVTTDRYGRTVAFVRVGDTLVNEELIRQRIPTSWADCCAIIPFLIHGPFCSADHFRNSVLKNACISVQDFRSASAS